MKTIFQSFKAFFKKCVFLILAVFCKKCTVGAGMASEESGLKTIDAKVQKSETWIESKKFTVYKVTVETPQECWFVFRRYNEFYKLHDSLKKQVPNLQLKLPGKKFFGNNLHPEFIAARRHGLDIFIQQLVADPKLMSLQEVKQFLKLDERQVNVEKTEEAEKVDLGPSERIYARPSDFEFLSVIGKGSFGKVFLAMHFKDKKYYAVKVLSKKLIMKRNEVRHIMSERNVLLKNLEHPFLVGLKFSFQTFDNLYFVLDYINGGDLYYHLQRETRFSEARARFYAAEITCAVGHLHSLGVIYRDLKPENILVDSDGHIMLTDFGLSKESDRTDTLCGTPQYLAPEVIRKEAYDRTVDWWCLGVLLYEMMYGLTPFYASNTAEMYNRILHKGVRMRPGVSYQARSIMTQLLEKDSKRRLGSGEGDADDIKNHPFFDNIDWEKVKRKDLEVAFKPDLNGPLDLRYIDPTFTQEPVVSSSPDSLTDLSVSVYEEGDIFADFSYAGSINTLHI
ncbi:serine/threonine-protein kinase Sgk2-like isoform X1 [Rhodnius prolixus]|uniref:serine/threonine-protein kinase Sgk2-like isoform X1 n=2 Tax=Rhodnius prolixus TaxID=13249 RepID=UPI003D18BD8C